MRKRYLAAAAAATFSFTALSQAPAFAADAPAGTLLHQVITNEQAGWAEPGGSTGITQGSITALPNGSSQIAAVTSGNALEYNTRSASGSWQGWDTLLQTGVTVENAGVAGMPNGSSQFIEVTSTGALEHNILEADGSWQSYGWGSPAGSTGISQAAITALPNGSSEIVAVTTAGTLELNVRSASGSWQGWDAISQPGVTVEDAGVAGMPDGSSQFIEVTSTGALEHNILEADGSWQADGWGAPHLSGPFTPSGITQAAITALPDGSSEIVVAGTNEPPAMGIRYSTGSWDTNWTQLYESPAYVSASGASIAGMPNGDTQVIEVAQSAS